MDKRALQRWCVRDLIEIIIKDNEKIVLHGSICDKFKIGAVEQIGSIINDEENKRELREEQPLGSSR